jgi:hypothetical protein
MPPYANSSKRRRKRQETRGKLEQNSWAEFFRPADTGTALAAVKPRRAGPRTPTRHDGRHGAQTRPTRRPGAARSGLYSTTANTLFGCWAGNRPGCPPARAGRAREGQRPTRIQTAARATKPPTGAPSPAARPPTRRHRQHTRPGSGLTDRHGLDAPPEATGAAPIRGPCGRAGEAQGSQGVARRSNGPREAHHRERGARTRSGRGANPARIAGAGAGLSLPPPPSWVGSNSCQPGGARAWPPASGVAVRPVWGAPEHCGRLARPLPGRVRGGATRARTPSEPRPSPDAARGVTAWSIAEVCPKRDALGGGQARAPPGWPP